MNSIGTIEILLICKVHLQFNEHTFNKLKIYLFYQSKDYIIVLDQVTYKEALKSINNTS